MRVAVIGAGRIGGNVARRLAAAGHELTISFARDEEALARRADEMGARSASPADAVSRSDVIVLSVPWDAIEAALDQAGPLRGKIIIDTTNQFGKGPKPADGQTAASFNAARMPGARYTKSFNTLTAAFQEETAGREPRVVHWLCGDDAAAKATVAELIADAGYVAVDLGSAAGCRVMEAPRRDGAVYGEEYREAEAIAAADAVAAGEPIPATPAYERAGRADPLG